MSRLPRFWARNGWTLYHALGAVLMVSLGVLLTYEAFADIFRIAVSDEESSHIFLVPIVAGWLLWVRRERFRQCYPVDAWLGPVLVAIGWVVSSYGYYNAVQAFWHGGAVVILVGCLVSVVGADVLRRFLPAFIVLAFLVPVPGMIRQQIAHPLQDGLATITAGVFELLGSPIEAQGNMLIVNGVEVAIAEACNGLRMVFALVLVSYAFAFGTPLRNYVRLIILALSPVSALVCNIIRMIPTVWLYGMSEQQWFGVPGDSVAKVFHDIAGWIMLVIAFLLLMAIIKLLRWALIPVTPYTLAYD